MSPQAGGIGYPCSQSVALGLSRGDSFNLSWGIAAGGKDGHLITLYDLKLTPQVHLDGLPVKVKGLLGNHFGSGIKVLLSLCDRCAAEITQPVNLEILYKTLEGLFISPGRADAMDTAIPSVVMPSLTEGHLLGHGMLGLRLC